MHISLNRHLSSCTREPCKNIGTTQRNRAENGERNWVLVTVSKALDPAEPEAVTSDITLLSQSISFLFKPVWARFSVTCT